MRRKLRRPMPRAMSAWADSSCEQVYLEREDMHWPKWAQGKVIVVKATDWHAMRRKP